MEGVWWIVARETVNPAHRARVSCSLRIRRNLDRRSDRQQRQPVEAALARLMLTVRSISSPSCYCSSKPSTGSGHRTTNRLRWHIFGRHALKRLANIQMEPPPPASLTPRSRRGSFGNVRSRQTPQGVEGGVLGEFPTRQARKTLAASDILSDIEPAKPETAGKRTRTDANGVSG